MLHPEVSNLINGVMFRVSALTGSSIDSLSACPRTPFHLDRGLDLLTLH